MGHAAAYSPLAKHRYEETSAKALGPVYRYRNYTNQIVVVNDPALQQEVDSHIVVPPCRSTCIKLHQKLCLNFLPLHFDIAVLYACFNVQRSDRGDSPGSRL